MLPDGLLVLLREWWRAGRQQGVMHADGWLFPGQSAMKPIGAELIEARTVLLATGVINHRPPMDEAAHAKPLARGMIRYCPICDGFEVTDKRVAVIGSKTRGYKEAIFLRMYTADVTLIALRNSWTSPTMSANG